MRKIVIISLAFAFLFSCMAFSQQDRYAKKPEKLTVVEKGLPTGPDRSEKQPAPYVGQTNAVGTYMNMYSFYDYQSNGGSTDFIEMSPGGTNIGSKIHAIMMSSQDSANVSSSRRVRAAYSTNYGQTWTATPRVLGGIRTGYPSLALNPYLGLGGYPAFIGVHADPDGDTYLSSYIYFEQGEGSESYTSDGYGPGYFLPDGPVQADSADQPEWPKLGVCPNGNTLLVGGRATANEVYLTVFNSSAEFSSWAVVDTLAADPARKTVAVGPSGKVAIVYSRGTSNTTYQMLYRLSTDNGATWAPPVVVDTSGPATGGNNQWIYWGGADAIWLGNTLYIAYPVSNADGLFAASAIKLFKTDFSTSSFMTVIDSTSYPLLLRTAPAPQSQGNHAFDFCYPALGKNLTETRLYLACDAFSQDQYYWDPQTGSWFYSDIIYTYTTDGGTTWNDVKNVTRTNDLHEYYVAMSTWNPKLRTAGNDSEYVYMAFSEKAHPGTNIQDSRPVERVNQKFLKINTDYKPAKDLSAISALLRNATGIHSSSAPETVKVKISNDGTETPPTSVIVTYKLNSAPANSTDGTTQTFTPTWSGKYADLVFTQTFTPSADSAGKNLVVYIRIFYPGDLGPDNDVTSKSITIAWNQDVVLYSISQTLPSPTFGTEKLPASVVKARTQNWGNLTSNVYSLNWKLGTSVQTPIAMNAIPYAAYDSANLTYNTTAKGTYYGYAWVDMAADSDRTNDTLGFYMRSYPANAFAIAYDSSFNRADQHWAHDTPDSAICCAVRFTATQDMRLTNVDAIYSNVNNLDSLITDSIIVYVWAAGVSDTAPGAILYSKKLGGISYINAVSSNSSVWMSLPVDADLAFANGADYWCGVQFTTHDNNFYPMGVLNLATPIPYPPPDPSVNRSFFSEDHDRIAAQDNPHWMPMRDVLISKPGGNISGKFLIRAVGVPTVAGGSFAINANWNMVSVPVNVTELKTELFPSAVSNAFKFVPGGVGYQPQTTLNPGPGYWLKFGSGYTATLYGDAITSLSIPVALGWNMIGSISASIATSAVTTTGSATIASQFYAYSAGYTPTTSIIPGKGVWVKSGGAGEIVLSSTLKPNVASRGPDVSAFNKLIVTDKNGNKQTLLFGENIDGKFPVDYFEMPPSAPEGTFDVRYVSQRMLETYPVDASEALEYAVSVRDAQFPITVSYELVSRTKSFVINDGKTDKVLSGDKGSVTVNNLKSGNFMLKVDALETVPTEYNLAQNYPNPFNPSTTFEFAMPKIAKVEIVVYDILGSKVATLFDGVKAAGYHKVEWNGRNSEGQVVPSGVYFVKMTSQGFSAIKKALMLK
jgi:hypothetical protein